MLRSFFSCHRTYRLISSSFSPTVLTQYPRAQKCLPQYRFFNSVCLSNILIELFPFRYPTTVETEYFGGIHNTKCTWSIWTFPSMISNSLHLHSSRIISRADRPISPFNIWNLYFGHHTKWYLHSHTACANFLKLLIEYLLWISRVTHLKSKEVFYFTSSNSLSLCNPYKHSWDHQHS